MKQFGKPKAKLKRILRLLVIVLCGLILGVNVYLANANSLLGEQIPMPFGYGAAVVLSGSMEPEMSKGDLIIVSKSDSYVLNDVVVFQDGNTLVVHRIIAIDGDTITTQGDANTVADNPIDKTVIKGEVIACIPWIGEIVNLIKTPIGTIGIIALAILLIEIPRRNEKKNDDEERQKIVEEIERLKKQL